MRSERPFERALVLPCGRLAWAYLSHAETSEWLRAASIHPLDPRKGATFTFVDLFPRSSATPQMGKCERGTQRGDGLVDYKVAVWIDDSWTAAGRRSDLNEALWKSLKTRQ